MTANETLNESHYRLAPTVRNGLLIAVAYAVILIILEILSGVPYTEIAANSGNLLRGVLIPVAVGSIILTIVALWSGWWKDIWREKHRIEGHTWLWIFPILLVVIIALNFASGDIGSVDAGFIAIALIATAFVGYSEELLTRGLLIRGARGSGYSEIGVFLISSVTFGLIHGLNIINGQAIGITVMQIITTAFFGGYLYVTLRKGGYLIPLMVLHALFDFSLLTQGRVVNTTTMIIAAFINYGMMILLLLAIRTFSVRNHEQGTDETASL